MFEFALSSCITNNKKFSHKDNDLVNSNVPVKQQKPLSEKD